jgi:uncharacterized protein (TIGR00369 family)
MPNPDKQLLQSHRPGDALAFGGPAQPFAKALGGVIIAVDRANGVVDLQFSPGQDFIQGLGVVHGGAVAAMLDFAMAFAGMAMLGDDQVVTTATLNIAFLRAAPAGAYVARGIVERRGRSLVFSRGELRAASGTLIATGTSTLAVLKAAG